MADLKKYRHIITDGMWAGNKYIPRPKKHRPLKRRKPRVLRLQDKYVDELVRLNNECTYDYDTPCLENFEPSRDLVYSYGELVDCEDVRRYDNRGRPRFEDDGLRKKGKPKGRPHKRKYKRPEELNIRPRMPEQARWVRRKEDDATEHGPRGLEAGVIRATKEKSLEQVREERLLLHRSASAAQKRWKERRLKQRMIVREIKRLVDENEIAEARKYYELLKRLFI
tara:strand:+ start:3506 stop:4180 length:675 start_codon:yes stop_codon:yes gene_type:complete